jgi:hypothetical protein
MQKHVKNHEDEAREDTRLSLGNENNKKHSKTTSGDYFSFDYNF